MDWIILFFIIRFKKLKLIQLDKGNFKMKKTVFLLLILCNVLTGCAKDYSSKIFKDCFNKSDESYEFNIRNPFFVDEFYVKDVKKLKNKIIKKTIEIYYLHLIYLLSVDKC